MQQFTSLDLQQRIGDVQRASHLAPVVVTSHGKARTVMMSVDEFVRLKSACGERVLVPSTSGAVVRRGPPSDPLGYDVSDLRTCALTMAADAMSGRGEDAVQAEVAAVERRFGAGR